MAMKRALLSVSNKEGIVELARELVDMGIEIISTGGTQSLLQENRIPVKGVYELTGFPEILDGRVKTLHPSIHAGILARRNSTNHIQQLEEHHLQTIDLVIVNLYPFKETIKMPNASFAEAIEQIDIGGPTMLRAAAKNHKDVVVVIDPNDYGVVLDQLKTGLDISYEFKRKLAAKVFQHTAHYDAIISQYFNEQVDDEFPEILTLTYEKKQDLRYGENPHQQAAFYQSADADITSIANAKQLHGKALSYNNISDADAALSIVEEFKQPAIVAVKHMNPCGVGIGSTIDLAFEKAYKADPVSIFGGIIASNREIEEQTAVKLKEIFLEIIIAPSFSKAALNILKEKKNLRLLQVELNADQKFSKTLTSVRGGLLVQEHDQYTLDHATITIPTKRKPSEKEWSDLQLGWQVVKHVKSNAILLVKDEMTIGIGAGQMNRVGACEIAVKQAGEKARGSVLASDAFMPMADTVEVAARAGVTAIIQPGGSIRDEDSIKKCNEYGMAMVFTGIRHFKH